MLNFSFKEFVAQSPTQPLSPAELKLQQLAKQVKVTAPTNPNAPPNPAQQAQQAQNDTLNKQILQLKQQADAAAAKRIADSINAKPN